MQDVNLKPLKPYDFAGLILPKTPDKVAMEWLPIAKLVVDEAYQRPISRSGLKNIEKIALGFRWSRFSPVIVTKILGQDLWAIIDGQHRTHAALALGYQQVPCYIVLAAGADAAQIFAAVNGNITPISLPSLYKAALAAEEPWALGIKTACAAAGIKVLMSNASVSRRQPYDTLAVGTLRRAYLDCGEKVLAAALISLRGAKDSATVNFYHSKRIRDWCRIMAGQPHFVAAPEKLAEILGQHDCFGLAAYEMWRLVLGGKIEPVKPPAVKTIAFVPPVVVHEATSPPYQKSERSEVWELYKRKFSKAQIAAKTKLPHARVEAILNGDA